MSLFGVLLSLSFLYLFSCWSDNLNYYLGTNFYYCCLGSSGYQSLSAGGIQSHPGNNNRFLRLDLVPIPRIDGIGCHIGCKMENWYNPNSPNHCMRFCPILTTLVPSY